MVLLFRVEGSLAALSMAGSMSIIVSFWMIPALRRHPTTLVFFMACCDFFFSLKFVVTSLVDDSTTFQENDAACALQSIFGQFFGLASISWNGMIAFNLLMQLKNPFANTASFAKFMHVYVWGLAAGTTIIMMALDEWGQSGDGTCWMKQSAWRLMFFIPLVSYFFISLAVVIAVMLRRKALTRQVAHDRTVSRVITRMTLYVAAFAVAWAGPTAHRLAQYNGWTSEESTKDPTLLMWVDAIGQSLYGFLNAIIWLSNPTFYKTFTRRVLVKAWNWITGKDEDRVPLLGALPDDMDDEMQDFQRLDYLLRKYVIMNILTGIETSLKRRSRAKSRGQSQRPASYGTSGRVLSLKRDSDDIDGVQLQDSPIHSSEDDNRSGYRHTHGPEHAHPHPGRDVSKDLRASEDEVRINFDDASYSLASMTGNPLVSGLPRVGEPDDRDAGGYVSASSQGESNYHDSIADLDKLEGGGGLGMWQQGYEFYDYSPEAFQQIRLLSGITNELYLQSLDLGKFMDALDQDQKFSEGRSGSFFCLSPDKKLIIKTIPDGEALLLRQILPQYLRHLRKHRESLLIRFFGCHAVRVQGLASSEIVSVVVMENVLYTSLSIHERYDLKGSWVRRKVGQAFEENRSKVLGMDLDLHRKLNLRSDQVTQLRRLISYDATFLRECGIMDYSLLLGFHFLNQQGSQDDFSMKDEDVDFSAAGFVPQPDLKRPFWQQYDGGILSSTGDTIYFMGVIDILQAYNGSKKRERCCKVYFLRKDSRGVSVQNPDVYCTRYLRAMAGLMVATE